MVSDDFRWVYKLDWNVCPHPKGPTMRFFMIPAETNTDDSHYCVIERALPSGFRLSVGYGDGSAQYDLYRLTNKELDLRAEGESILKRMVVPTKGPKATPISAP